uniref:Uncharacterized protein n=1 Tax=Nothoprocta perdicaria TaxID=30464 RepID=A0A8C6ZMI7_NOTPE
GGDRYSPPLPTRGRSRRPPRPPRRRRRAGRRPRQAPAAARSARCRCGRSPCRWRWGAGRGSLRAGEGGGVVVDVQDDDPALKEVHPALRGADDRHLEVQEALVLVEDHLALRQLLAVDAPLRGAQLPGHVIDLEVVGARFQAECHLSGARHDAQVGSHVTDADVGGSLLGQSVPKELLGRRQADPERRRQKQQEAAAAAAMHKAKESPHLPHLRTEKPPPLSPTRPPIDSPDEPTAKLSVRVISYKILLFQET